jgi:glyoxylase-like metal-dependent hydrolase (beta-lactamase superfamily II)
MRVETFVVGPFECNCWVLSDETTREAVIVDPGADDVRILEFVRNEGLTVRWIVHTHAHLDHIGGAGTVKDAVGGRLLLHEADRELWDGLPRQGKMFGLAYDPAPPVDEWLSDGAEFLLSGRPMRVLHTPGHTPGSVCILLPSEALLLAGDTLFAGSIGRTDLWGGSHPQLMDSIRSKLLTLDDAVRVLPGHGLETTIGAERRTNPFISGRQL